MSNIEDAAASAVIRGVLGRLPLQARDRWLCIFDFDGTLSAIAESPDRAVLDPLLLVLLEPLRARIGWLAVLSGRDRASLAGMLPPDWLAIGSYGLELPRELETSGLAPDLDPVRARAALEQARPALAKAVAAWPGARLEEKAWGLAVHIRGMADPPDGETIRASLTPVAEAFGLHLVTGRQVYELRPQTAVDKGWAVRYLVARLDPSAAIFVGDDVGDVPAWEALMDASQRIPTIAIGVASTEAPPEVMRICDLVLPGREALLTFCENLLELAG
jgi:trehalose 6-phosphate phosphatase